MGISRFEDSVPTVPLPLAEVRLVEAGLAPGHSLSVCLLCPSLRCSMYGTPQLQD